jgi:hypothetical protein
MLKKTLFYSLISCSLLFGDYYSVSDSTPNGTKTLKFENGIVVNLKNNIVDIKSKSNLDYLLDGTEAKEYEPTQFTIIKKVKDTNNPDKMIKVKDTINYNTYNLSYLILNNVEDEKFVLKIPNGSMLIKTIVDNDTIDSVLNGEEDVNKYKYIVEKSFDNNGKEINIKERNILTKYIDNNGNIVAIDFLDNGLHKIIEVDNEKLKKFLEEKKSRVVNVKNFDFSKERIYTTYLSASNSSQKRLSIKYEMKGKNIKISAKSPISLLDPESHSNSIEENIGFLREFKNKKNLIEGAKVQLIDGIKDVEWQINLRKKVVLLSYINEGHRDMKILSISDGQQFYSIEGVVYLVSWMSKNNIDKKVFTFINGSLPFDVTMIKTAKGVYEMEKEGNLIYKFEVDNRNIVKKILFPDYDISIILESIDSDTTLKNKKYLKDFANRNNIILVKE